MDTSRVMQRHTSFMICAVLVALLQACATTSAPSSVSARDPSRIVLSGATDQFDDAQWEILKKGVGLVEQKQLKLAVTTSFDPIIAAYAARYSKPDPLVYSALTMTETLMYLMKKAVRTDEGEAKHSKTIVVGPAWSYAWFWKAYTLGELGENVAAQAALAQALRLAPNNPKFLSELGFTYTREGRWIEALTTYESAEAFASFAPDENQNEERGRAWRGQAYVLVELGRLDDAEAKYRACLKLDPKDEMARTELGYVLEQKAKAKAEKL